MRKVLAAMLCVILVFGMLPVGVAAQETKQSFSLVEAIEQEARSSYYKSQKSAGKKSFHGKCGTMVGHQLYNLGIIKRPTSFSGNKGYDTYADKEKTSGGYYITPYSASDYSLYDALMAVTQNGTKNVKNILVGFQWTNTELGQRFGHAMLINGIVDGTVYFVESFDSASLGGPEGSVLNCSIKAFAEYYNRWTVFDGLIHFGMGTYYDVCPSTPTDLSVQARFDTTLRSEPAVIGRQGCTQLRTVAAGERLRATAIYEDEGAFYYRVETNEGFGFVAASAVRVLQVNTEGISISDLALPKQMRPGAVPAFGGSVSDTSGSISTLEVCITDMQGQLIRREVMQIDHGTAQLADMRSQLWFDLLELGAYHVEVYVSRACLVVTGNSTDTHHIRVLLGSRSLYVGNNPREIMQVPQGEPEKRDGWFRENGTWYCYKDGQPCTGWARYMGVRYYLQEDGSVTTGAQIIEEKARYFSATGAMLTGWQTLDGKLYCYGQDGVMLTNTEAVKDGQIYTIAADGIATQKQEMQDGETLF